MRSRSPSIVPPEANQDTYLVLDDFGGRLGRAWRETDEEDTDRVTLIRDLMDDQYSHPARIVAFTDWLHEIKYDGYRLRVERDGNRVRLITRNGYDWTKRYPWIVGSALKNRMKQFVIDGEAVILGVDGVSDFRRAAFGQTQRGGPALRL